MRLLQGQRLAEQVLGAFDLDQDRESLLLGSRSFSGWISGLRHRSRHTRRPSGNHPLA